MPMDCPTDCILAIRLWGTGELVYRNPKLIGVMPEKYRLWLSGYVDYDDHYGFHRPRAHDRASGSGLSREDRVSVPEGAPHESGGDHPYRGDWRPTLHGGRADVQEDLVAHEAAAKRRRQDMELKDHIQKAAGVAGATLRDARAPERLIERKATDAGPQGRDDGAVQCPKCGQVATRGSISCANFRDFLRTGNRHRCSEHPCRRDACGNSHGDQVDRPRGEL